MPVKAPRQKTRFQIVPIAEALNVKRLIENATPAKKTEQKPAKTPRTRR